MVVLDDIKLREKTLKGKLDDLFVAVDADKLRVRRAELETLQQDPDLYKDVAKAAKINGEAKFLDERIATVDRMAAEMRDLEEMTALVESEDAADMVEELETGLKKLEDEAEALRLETLLKGEYDRNNAILTLHAGAGGTEAQDWVSMLYRMYRMYAARNGFAVEELDMLPGDEAGIKSVTFTLSGVNAYGYLKAEKGVHRLVRISPFDSNARRHTSFASLDVMPEVENDTSVVINPDDIRVDRYRSGGAGGQHVNKTDSAVRMTHLPTGIVVQCQDERSQIKNREKAMKVLKTKLYDLMQSEADKEYSANRKSQVGTGDRSERIRTYNFPQGRVTDHRINMTLYSLDAFLNGDVTEMLEALRIADQTAKLEAEADA